MVAIKKYLFFLFTLKLTSAVLIKDLNGDCWLVKDEAGDYQDVKAVVPGGIYTDLMANGLLVDIFYGNNDVNSRWVARKNWAYYTSFSVGPEVMLQESIHVIFEGVDTFSTVYLNDVKIGETSNMFTRYIFDIKHALKQHDNRLEVKFQSPLKVADNVAAEQKKQYVIPPECPPKEYNGDCHVNMIRKMQASFGWDWGPSFPSVGIWKNVTVEAYNESVVRYVVVDIEDKPADNSWLLNVDVYLANNTRGYVEGKLDFELDLGGKKKMQGVDVAAKSKDTDEEIKTSSSLKIPKSMVKKWWPNGYGSPDLYNLTVTFTNLQKTEQSIMGLKIGFRSVELVQEPLGSGLSFYFKVNGVPIYMKGSNEIPIDILPERGQDKKTIRRLLESAGDANMNTLRVWGGGVYESDYFYEVADELGIMIWQDFMFAVALYPANDKFLSNVIGEIRHQVKRLKSHPSIVVFAGNNENELVLAHDWFGVRPNESTYKNDYVKLYHHTIEKEFSKLTYGRTVYITSSPTNGKKTVEDGYVSTDPLSSDYGDVHFYNYDLNPWDSNVYPVPRLSSEYGYQSLPSMETFRTATNEIDDLNIKSDFMAHRQHRPNGSDQILKLMDYNLKLPDSNNEKYPEIIIYYSQIIQAMAVKMQTEHYRLYKSRLNNKGQGYTRGALYWQLNDVWVAPTWSGIDYYGRWKMLHYFAKNFFAPVIVAGEINTEQQLGIYVVSDLISPIKNAIVTVKVFKWDSFDPVSTKKITIDVVTDESKLATSISVNSYLSSVNCGSSEKAKYNCFFHLTIHQDGQLIAPENIVLPAAIKESNLRNTTVTITFVKQIHRDGEFHIEVTTDGISLFVWLDSHEILGRFSENGFLMVEANKIVSFRPDDAVNIDDFKNILTVTHLTNY